MRFLYWLVGMQVAAVGGIIGCSDGDGSSSGMAGGSGLESMESGDPDEDVNGVAEDECLSTAACLESERCFEGACVPRVEDGGECDESRDCADELACVDEVCASVGGVDEPCDPEGDACDDTLLCSEGTCVETVSVRFCHCIFANGGASDATLYLTLGGQEYDPTVTDICSMCMPVPFGEGLAYNITDGDGKVWASGTLEPETTTEGVVVFGAGGVKYGTNEEGCSLADPISCD